MRNKLGANFDHHQVIIVGLALCYHTFALRHSKVSQMHQTNQLRQARVPVQNLASSSQPNQMLPENQPKFTNFKFMQ